MTTMIDENKYDNSDRTTTNMITQNKYLYDNSER